MFCKKQKIWLHWLVRYQVTTKNAFCNKLTLLKDKIENLCFWDKIKTGDLEPVSKRRAAYIKANKTQTRNMLPTPTEEETCLGNEFDAQEAAREKRYFPSNSKVYHFHPIAFVEQMKLMQETGIPPWMEVALEEYKKYLGKGEKETPLKEKIFDYFDISSFTEGNNRTHWCGSFVNWCLEKSEFNTPSANAAARSWSPKGNYEYYWKDGLESKEPFFGAIAMINWKGGGQHVAFVIGETKNGNIAILGGNQGKHEGGGITQSSAKKSEIQFYMYPKNYKIPISYFDLDIIDITDKLTFDNTH